MKDKRSKAELKAALDALAAEAWSGVAYIDPIHPDTGKPFNTTADAASASGYQALAHALDPEAYPLDPACVGLEPEVEDHLPQVV